MGLAPNSLSRGKLNVLGIPELISRPPISFFAEVMPVLPMQNLSGFARLSPSETFFHSRYNLTITKLDPGGIACEVFLREYRQPVVFLLGSILHF